MFTLEVAKRSFFDRGKVVGKYERGRDAALANLGARVRTTSQRSIRKRKKSSPPGQPPSSHVGTLRKGILFARDPSRTSVVIGPIILGSANGAPERLEYGGDAMVGRPKSRRKARYLARPYMHPAFKTELLLTPARFKDIIH